MRAYCMHKMRGTPFAKSKIERVCPNFIHCMYLIFEPILLRRKFWGVPLRRNGVQSITFGVFGPLDSRRKLAF